jgi:hypothetical protein
MRPSIGKNLISYLHQAARVMIPYLQTHFSHRSEAERLVLTYVAILTWL